MSIKNKFPNIKPSLNLDFANTKRLDPRITFTRASTATYWDGVTHAKAEENLIRYSHGFDNAAWAKQNATVIANSAVAPDGTATAQTLCTTLATALASVSQTGTCSGQQVLSVYAKAGPSFSYLRVNVIGGTAAVFNLSDGSVSVPGSLSPSILSVGSGWYRCVVTHSLSISAGITASFAVSDASGNVITGDGASGIYIWGAQLEQRSQVTAYTPTTDQPITKYQPALQTAASGAPRFDHNPVTGESLGLLIEESRTNLLKDSAELGSAAWVRTYVSITANTIVAPDGTLTGDKATSSADLAFHELWSPFDSVSGTTYTGSYFVKAGGHRFVQLLGTGVVFAEYANFDLLTGTRTAGTAGFGQIQPVGNGWYRISITAVALSSSATARFAIALVASGASGRAATYTGNGYSGIYIWGAQLEAGAFPTSYIPTTSAQVTRAADAAVMTGANFSSWYRQDEGTVYANASTFGLASAGQGVVTVGDGSLANRHGIYAALDFSRVGGYSVSGSATSADLQTVGAASVGVFSAAYAYKPDNFAFSANGGNTNTDAAGVVPGYIDRLEIGRFYQTSIYYLNGHIRKLAYYPKRLSNAQLQALTA